MNWATERGQEGQFAPEHRGVRGLVIEDFWHFECRKYSEMHFKPIKRALPKKFSARFARRGFSFQFCPWASKSCRRSCRDDHKYPDNLRGRLVTRSEIPNYPTRNELDLDAETRILQKQFFY